MAIPLIVGGLALLAGGFGVKKGLDAKENFSRAERIVRNSDHDFIEAGETLEARREAVSESLENLGRLRLQVESKSLGKMVELMNQVHGAEIGSIEIEGCNITIDEVDVKDISVSAYQATDFLEHGLAGASSGALVGVGIGQTVGLLGSASTGAAISGLSGAAASNATLAWLGGGSLASGGLGVAGGTAVLGGAIAGPVIAVMGYMAAGKSEKALTEATAHSAELDMATEQLKNGVIALDAIEERAREVEWVINELNDRFKKVAQRVSREFKNIRREQELKILNAGKEVPKNLFTKKINYQNLGDKATGDYTSMMLLGSALFNVLKVNILNNKGGLTRESAKTVLEMKNMLEVV